MSGEYVNFIHFLSRTNEVVNLLFQIIRPCIIVFILYYVCVIVSKILKMIERAERRSSRRYEGDSWWSDLMKVIPKKSSIKDWDKIWGDIECHKEYNEGELIGIFLHPLYYKVIGGRIYYSITEDHLSIKLNPNYGKDGEVSSTYKYMFDKLENVGGNSMKLKYIKYYFNCDSIEL